MTIQEIIKQDLAWEEIAEQLLEEHGIDACAAYLCISVGYSPAKAKEMTYAMIK